MHSRLSSSYIFLLILLLIFPRHLAFAAPLNRRSPSSSSEESSAPAAIVWNSPAPGDHFGPGDTIRGEWQVTSESQNPKVVSPSFRLCAGGEDGCGATIWPEVIVDESTGYYYITLTAPNVTTETGYYLQMKDDFDHTYTSPIFNLTPTPQKKDKTETPEPAVAQPRPRPDQAPMSSSSSSSSHGTKSNGAAHSDPVAPAPPAAAAAASASASATPVEPGGTVAGSMAPNANSTTSLTPGSGNSASGGTSGPLVAAAHGAPPTAALAVPLSLAGAIVLLASGLALHHRRKLADERARCNAQLAATAAKSSSSSSNAPSSSSSESTSSLRPPPVGLALNLGRRITTNSSRRDRDSGRGSNSNGDYYDDSEKALCAARALLRGVGFSDRAYDGYYDRRSGDAAAAAANASYSHAPSSYVHAGAREPRQRTRQPDPLATPRRRAHPSSSSSSSSSTSSSPSPHPPYRGIFGSRHGVWRSGSSTYNGSGASSLWRSLSIARRKTALSSTSLASPALTESVASVTSEVLPSYLPSPNFVGPVAQAHGYGYGAGAGDFGFENVPLSPPRPQPLHTRGEAVEPDDSRMRELRGVYEAVAHALGSVRRV